MSRCRKLGLVCSVVGLALALLALCAGAGEQPTAPPPAAYAAAATTTSPPSTTITDQDLAQLRQQRFNERVGRVLDAMRQERIDFQAVPYLTADGRVAARVQAVDVETTTQ